MADEWKAIFAYVCFAIGALLILLGIIRILWWVYMEREDSKRERYKRYLMHLRRGRAGVPNNSYMNGGVNRVDKGYVYTEPSRPTSVIDSSYVNPAVLYEDAKPPPSSSSASANGGTEFYETIERTMIIGQSVPDSPESKHSVVPALMNSGSLSTSYDRASALAALERATAGEESVGNTPRMFADDKNNVYMVTGDNGTSIVKLPKEAAAEAPGTYSYRYKTYSHEPLPDAREIEYQFATSTH